MKIRIILSALIFSTQSYAHQDATRPSPEIQRPLLVASFCQNVGGWHFDRDRIRNRFSSLGYEIQELPCKRADLLAIQIPADRRGVFFYTGHGSAQDSGGVFGSRKKFVFNTQDQDVYAEELLPKIPGSFFLWIDACFSGAIATEFPDRVTMHAASDSSAAFSSPKVGGSMSTWVHEILISPWTVPMDLDRNGKITARELSVETESKPDFFSKSFRYNRKYVGLGQAGAGLHVPRSIPDEIVTLELGIVDPNGPEPGGLPGR